MPTIDAALVKEHGVSFAVISVRDIVLDNPSQRDENVEFGCHFFRIPTVLMGARKHKLYGRSDIVRFLKNVSPERLPWKRYSY